MSGLVTEVLDLSLRLGGDFYAYFLKRVADPDDPYTYRDARHAMRPRKGPQADKRRGMIYEAGKAPVPIAKNKKSA